jgi:hypothetical protein
MSSLSIVIFSVHTALAQAVGTFLGAPSDAERQKRIPLLAQSGGTKQISRTGWAAAFFSSFLLITTTLILLTS